MCVSSDLPLVRVLLRSRGSYGIKLRLTFIGPFISIRRAAMFCFQARPLQVGRWPSYCIWNTMCARCKSVCKLCHCNRWDASFAITCYHLMLLHSSFYTLPFSISALTSCFSTSFTLYLLKSINPALSLSLQVFLKDRCFLPILHPHHLKK